LIVKVALNFAPLCMLYRFPGCYTEVPVFQRNVLPASSGRQYVTLKHWYITDCTWIPTWP